MAILLVTCRNCQDVMPQQSTPVSNADNLLWLTGNVIGMGENHLVHLKETVMPCGMEHIHKTSWLEGVGLELFRRNAKICWARSVNFTKL